MLAVGTDDRIEGSDESWQQLLPKKPKNKHSYVDGIAAHEDLVNSPPGWRKSLGVFIESRRVQVLVIVLTILDLILVGADLILEERFGKCNESETTNEWVEFVEEILGYASVSILVLLGGEILLVMIAFGSKFFKHPFYILDMLVIGLSLVFELVLKTPAGTLLVIFRLWRLVRVAHGVAATIEERTEQKIHHLEHENSQLKQTLERWKVDYHITENVKIE